MDDDDDGGNGGMADEGCNAVFQDGASAEGQELLRAVNAHAASGASGEYDGIVHGQNGMEERGER